MSGYTKQYLLDCNRKLSQEFQTNPNSENKAVFTNEVGDGLQVNIGDKISVHSAYVSSIGAGGEVVEVKGEIFGDKSYTLNKTEVKSHIKYIPTNGSTLDYTDENYYVDFSASQGYALPNGSTTVYTYLSNTSETYTLKDNEVFVEVEFYKNTNGKNYCHLPRRFDKLFTEEYLGNQPTRAQGRQYARNYYNLWDTSSEGKPENTTYELTGGGSRVGPSGNLDGGGFFGKFTLRDFGAPYQYVGCVNGNVNRSRFTLQQKYDRSISDALGGEYAGRPSELQYPRFSGSIVGSLLTAKEDTHIRSGHSADDLESVSGFSFRASELGFDSPWNRDGFLDYIDQHEWQGGTFNSYSNIMPENKNTRWTIMVQDGDNVYADWAADEPFLDNPEENASTNTPGNKFFGTYHGGGAYISASTVSGTPTIFPSDIGNASNAGVWKHVGQNRPHRDRPPWTYKYHIYKENIKLEAETGFDSPSNISTDFTNQLNKINQQPQSISSAIVPPLDRQTKLTESFNISIKTESPTFKLFRAANPVNFDSSHYIDYIDNGSSLQPNTRPKAIQYNNNFLFIAAKRPDLLTLGRDIHGEYCMTTASLAQTPAGAVDSITGETILPSASATTGLCGGQHFKLLHTYYPAPFSGSYSTDHPSGDGDSGNPNIDFGNASHLIITDKLWDETNASESQRILHGKPLLERLSKLFKAQSKYPELFNYPNYYSDKPRVRVNGWGYNASQTSVSVEHCRFLHMGVNNFNASYRKIFQNSSGVRYRTNSSLTTADTAAYTYSTDNGGGFCNNYGYLGNDYWSNSGIYSTTNCCMTQSSTPTFIVYNASMEDKYGEGKDSKFGSDLGYGFAVKYHNPSDGKDYIAFKTTSYNAQWINRTQCDYGAFGRFKTNASWSPEPSNPNYSTWGPLHGTSGMPCLFKGTPFGWDYSANAYGCPLISLYTSQIGQSQNTRDGGEIQSWDSLTVDNQISSGIDGETRFNANSYINQVYCGSDSPLLSFDSNGNRFSLSNLHTMERLGNKYDAGFDSTYPIIDDAANKVYKINPRLTGLSYCPDMKPYERERIDTNTSLTTLQMNRNLSSNIIYDSHTGIKISNTGISFKDWKYSLWNTLGFSYEQFNQNASNFQFRLNDTKRPNTIGITTNAQVLQSDIQNYSVNLYGAVMFDTLLPTSKDDWKEQGATNDSIKDNPTFPAINVTQKSIEILAENLPIKSTRPYYLIRSDIIPVDSYRGARSDLPIVAVATKINGYQDAYSQDGTQLEFTITKPYTIQSITTQITDPDGSLARVDDYSGVIYKVTKNIQAQTDLSSIYAQDLQQRENIRQQQQEQFFSVLGKMNAQQFFQEQRESQRISYQAPNPFISQPTREELRQQREDEFNLVQEEEGRGEFETDLGESEVERAMRLEQENYLQSLISGMSAGAGGFQQTPPVETRPQLVSSKPQDESRPMTRAERGLRRLQEQRRQSMSEQELREESERQRRLEELPETQRARRYIEERRAERERREAANEDRTVTGEDRGNERQSGREADKEEE